MRQLNAEDKMNMLNFEIANVKVDGAIGFGSGSLEPRVIFVGQNPGQSAYNGYRFFSNPKDGSSQLLLPILDRLGIHNQVYFTNIVHSTTVDNAIPDHELVNIWAPYFSRELAIVSDKDSIILAMGAWTSNTLHRLNIKHDRIWHPSYIRHRRPDLKDEYEEIIRRHVKSTF